MYTIDLVIEKVGLEISYEEKHFETLEDFKSFIKQKLSVKEINYLGNHGYLELDNGPIRTIYRLDDLSARAWSSAWSKTKEAIEVSK